MTDWLDRIDAVVDDKRAREDTAAAAKSREDSEAAERFANSRKTLASTVRPVLDDVAQRLTTKGVQASVTGPEGAGLSISDAANFGLAVPNSSIRFSTNRASGGGLVVNTDVEGKKGQHAMSAADCEVDAVRKRVVEFVTEAANARGPGSSSPGWT